MLTLILIALAGAAANLVDGGIGMGFGVTSTTILLLAGLGPAQASAVVHTAELGTTAISGLSHARFGNVDWKTVVRLGVPGGIAAFLGATLLSNISTAAAAPVTALILVGIGANLIWRFSQPRRRGSAYKRTHSTPFLAGLGLVGGFVDSTGGGGWGPVSTSTLMAIGREQPRRIVGTVNAAEFLVTFGATAGFIVGLWHDIVANLAAVIALLIGGAITAPIAAWLISRINPVLLRTGRHGHRGPEYQQSHRWCRDVLRLGSACSSYLRCHRSRGRGWCGRHHPWRAAHQACACGGIGSRKR